MYVWPSVCLAVCLSVCLSVSLSRRIAHDLSRHTQPLRTTSHIAQPLVLRTTSRIVHMIAHNLSVWMSGCLVGWLFPVFVCLSVLRCLPIYISCRAQPLRTMTSCVQHTTSLMCCAQLRSLCVAHNLARRSSCVSRATSLVACRVLRATSLVVRRARPRSSRTTSLVVHRGAATSLVCRSRAATSLVVCRADLTRCASHTATSRVIYLCIGYCKNVNSCAGYLGATVFLQRDLTSADTLRCTLTQVTTNTARLV